MRIPRNQCFVLWNSDAASWGIFAMTANSTALSQAFKRHDVSCDADGDDTISKIRIDSFSVMSVARKRPTRALR